MNRRLRAGMVWGCIAAVGIGAYVQLHHWAPLSVLSPRRWDKIWQLLFLVPALVGGASLAGAWIQTDLARSLQGATRWFRPGWLLLLGVAVLVAVALVPLGHMPRSRDEAEYLFQGRVLLTGGVSVPAPPCPRNFELQGLLVRDGRWFAAYDPGHPILLGLGHALGASWLVGPVLGGVALWLLYCLGRELYGSDLARGALGLGVVSPFFFFLAASHSYHVSSLVLSTCVLICTMRRGRGAIWDLLEGCTLGALVLVRPLGLVVLAVPLLVLEIHAWRERRWLVAREWGRVLLAFLPLLCGYLLYNNALTGNPLVTGRQLLYPTSLFGFGVEAAHGPSYGSVGHTPVKGILNLGLQLGTLSTGLLGWPLLSLIPALIGFFGGRRGPWEWVFGLMFGATAVVLFFSWYSAVEHGPRHYLDAWPGLMLLSARGISLVWRRVGPVTTRRNLLILVVAGLFVVAWLLYMPVRVREVRGPWLGVDPALGGFVAERVQPPALVFMEVPEAEADYYTSGFVHNDPLLRAPILYARHHSAREDRLCLGCFPGRSGYLLTYRAAPRSISVTRFP